MTRDVRAVLLSATLVTALSTGLPAQRPARTAAETALDRYVAAPDPAYSFRTVGELSAPAGVSASLLELTSQHWLTEKEVDRPLWRHWLIVYRPVIVTRDVALLFISGGNNDDKRPAKANGVLASLARDTASITAELRMVPNQRSRSAATSRRLHARRTRSSPTPGTVTCGPATRAGRCACR